MVAEIGSGQGGGDINSLRNDASTIVVGSFGGYGAAHWNTADGRRPTVQENASTPASLVRPIAIDVKGDLKGTRSDAASAVQRGGEDGCDRISFVDDPVLKEGQSYIYFLVPLVDNTGSRLEEQLLLEAWPVGADDRVETPNDGSLTMDQLKEAIDKGKPVETLNPNEPSGPPQG